MHSSTENVLQLFSDVDRICGPRTLWLFTVSEHLTIVVPWVAFGVLGALSGPAITTNNDPSAFEIVQRAPGVVCWMWLNILIFTISNQRLPESLDEDRSNKPWRPLPAGRISVNEARQLLLCLLPVVYFVTLWLGSGDKTLYGMVLMWMYNDLQGSDSVVTRNLINSLGLTCWSMGVTEVACGISGFTISSAGYRWLLLLGVLIFTTLQLQDFRDQAGDRIKGRKTLPIVIGDDLARTVTSFSIVAWSLVCPAIWSLGAQYYALPVTVGAVIALRLLRNRDSRSDEVTWKLWGGWMFCIFTLPLCKHHEALTTISFDGLKNCLQATIAATGGLSELR